MRTEVVGIIVGVMLLFFGCALKVDPLHVDGTVNHVIEFDPVKLADFFTEACQKTVADPTDPTQVQQCVTDGIAQFWNAVNASKPQ